VPTVARALVTRPAVLLADEPTGALDSATGAELLALLRATCRDTGQTIVMVTHDPRAASYAQRIVFLADGRVTGELTDPTPDAVLDRIRRLER
jgi:putative ABC transport system ATP-binding protein